MREGLGGRLSFVVNRELERLGLPFRLAKNVARNGPCDLLSFLTGHNLLSQAWPVGGDCLWGTESRILPTPRGRPSPRTTMHSAGSPAGPFCHPSPGCADGREGRASQARPALRTVLGMSCTTRITSRLPSPCQKISPAVFPALLTKQARHHPKPLAECQAPERAPCLRLEIGPADRLCLPVAAQRVVGWAERGRRQNTKRGVRGWP